MTTVMVRRLAVVFAALLSAAALALAAASLPMLTEALNKVNVAAAVQTAQYSGSGWWVLSVPNDAPSSDGSGWG